MSAFSQAHLISKTGIEAPLDPTHPDSPYNLSWHESEVARSFWQSPISAVEWMYGESRVSTSLINIESVALNTASDLLIIVLGYGEQRFARPNNAIVLQPDGSLNHQIAAPPFVQSQVAGVSAKRPVEWIAAVHAVGSRTIVDLGFNREWIQRRYYDPSCRQWQEQDHIHRL